MDNLIDVIDKAQRYFFNLLMAFWLGETVYFLYKLGWHLTGFPLPKNIVMDW
jgi:hypothetical protein